MSWRSSSTRRRRSSCSAARCSASGAAAALQYLAILVAGGLALVLQDRVASLVLGSSAGVSLPEGLTITLLVLFCVYGVLGFLLYAVLYAAAGSLVSRQEDVNGAVMPMTMITMVGYMVAVYAATGLLDIRAGWVAVLSQIPFISPFLMPSRIVAGEACWMGGRALDRDPARRRSRSPSGSPPACTPQASSCTDSGRACGRSGG